MLLKPQPIYRPKSKRLPKGNAVTVCIAALCNGGTVLIGASDRMMTAGDMIEYEPQQQTKLYALSAAIVGMCAGDASLQAEIMQRVQLDVNTRIHTSPDDWWRVRDVAFLYNKHYNAEKNRRAESAILSPLGLTSATFLRRQATMNSTVVKQLTEEIVNFEMPEAETIIAGIDETGAHIYVITGANIACHDTAGFAAIGGGSWHANSELMFAAHSRFKLGPEVLFRTFSAKKRAETAPGVGPETDMWAMSPNLGSLTTIPPDVIADIGKIYVENQKNINSEMTKVQEKMHGYVQKLAEEAPNAPQGMEITQAQPAALPESKRDGASTTREDAPKA